MTIKVEFPFQYLKTAVDAIPENLTGKVDVDGFLRIASGDMYVNVYLENKAYGGPEEGGWWYRYASPEKEKCEEYFSERDEPAKKYLQRVQEAHTAAVAWCDEENRNRNSDIGSMASDGRYTARIESDRAASWPEERPHYE